MNMKPILMLCCLAWVWVAGCALQQDVVTLDNRTLRLERQLSDMNDILSRLDSGLENKTKSEENLRTQSADIRASMGRMTEQIQEIRGKVETTDYQLNRQVAAVEETIARLDERLAALEAYLNITDKSRPAVPSPAPAPAAKPVSEAEGLYTTGLKYFDEGKFAESRQTFTDYLKKFPKSAQADNAQFWIAETYYREQWLEKAILEYQKVIEAYPKGNKVPASLLKQAMAFSDLGDKANAKLILQELIGKYPNSSEAAVAAEKIKQL
jgi:tol-pal system protein YbgF